MYLLCVLLLFQSKISFIVVLTLRVLSETDLIVLEEDLDLVLEVSLKSYVVLGSDCFGDHLIEVECLEIESILLLLPFLAQSHSKSS
mgnify:CR=1 FL=1